MSQREDVLRQAMALPADDRAYVVTVLERSLANTARLAGEAAAANDEFSNEALSAELERRSADYRAGAMAGRPVEEVLADLKARQASEHSVHDAQCLVLPD